MNSLYLKAAVFIFLPYYSSGVNESLSCTKADSTDSFQKHRHCEEEQICCLSNSDSTFFDGRIDANDLHVCLSAHVT